MTLKEYSWNGRTWQFDESDAPEGAEPLEKAAKPAADKAARPATNKARSQRAKKAE